MQISRQADAGGGAGIMIMADSADQAAARPARGSGAAAPRSRPPRGRRARRRLQAGDRRGQRGHARGHIETEIRRKTSRAARRSASRMPPRDSSTRAGRRAAAVPEPAAAACRTLRPQASVASLHPRFTRDTLTTTAVAQSIDQFRGVSPASPRKSPAACRAGTCHRDGHALWRAGTCSRGDSRRRQDQPGPHPRRVLHLIHADPVHPA